MLRQTETNNLVIRLITSACSTRGRGLALAVLVHLFPLLALSQTEYNLHPSSAGVICHQHYCFSYSEEHEQAEWVMYELTAEEAAGGYARTDDFRPDPLVASGSAQLSDYRGSGYDRGHLAPAADMSFSPTAISESFYLSNMSPQDPSFNRGGWRKLEGLCRAWALEDGEVYVVTGPVLSRTRGKIGGSGVSVPAYYYKIVFDIDEDGARSIAFLMPNASIRGNLNQYVVSVDSLEALTGLDFFPALPDNLENQLEAGTVGIWNLQLSPGTTRSATTSTSAARQCAGTTQDGDRCRRRTTNSSGYCWQHTQQTSPGNLQPARRSSAVQCKGSTQSGSRCRRTTKNRSGYCWQHE